MENIVSASSWESKLNAVVEYKGKFGKFPTYRKKGNEEFADILAKWIQYQKECEVKGKLKNEYKVRLESISGWKWTENSIVRKRVESQKSEEIPEKKKEFIGNNYTDAQLSVMKLDELRCICRNNKYDGFSKFCKADLIKFILTFKEIPAVEEAEEENDEVQEENEEAEEENELNTVKNNGIEILDEILDRIEYSELFVKTV